MMDDWHDGFNGGGWILMIVMMLVVLCGLLGGAYLLTRATNGTNPRRSALAILDERFARGEIDAAEYRDRRQALGT